MLKIKDNVDLKELEKFGFDTNGLKYYVCADCDDDKTGLIVSCKTREIMNDIDSNGMDISTDETNLILLYKLIKADLVEEVSNE